MAAWQDIPWKKVHRHVFRLQKRIYQATQRGHIRTVHKLQNLLLKSWYARLLAVRRVSQDNRGHGVHTMMNRILSGVRRPKNACSGVQPAWSTPDRIGWTKPLHRGAGPTGNWNHRPRAPRHAGGTNPLQADRRRGQVAPCPRLCTAAHPPTRSARGEVPPSAHARGPSRRGIHRVCRGVGRQYMAS